MSFEQIEEARAQKKHTMSNPKKLRTIIKNLPTDSNGLLELSEEEQQMAVGGLIVKTGLDGTCTFDDDMD